MANETEDAARVAKETVHGDMTEPIHYVNSKPSTSTSGQSKQPSSFPFSKDTCLR